MLDVREHYAGQAGGTVMAVVDVFVRDVFAAHALLKRAGMEYDVAEAQARSRPWRPSCSLPGC